MATYDDHLAAARGQQADGNWAAVAAEYQAAIDTLDRTQGDAINE